MKLSLVPLLPFTVAFVAGLLMQGSGVGCCFLILPVVAAFLFWLLKRPYAALMCCGVMVGFALSFARSASPLSEKIEGRHGRYSGVALEVKSYEPTQILITEVDSCDGIPCKKFLVKVTVPSSLPDIDERDRVNFSAVINSLVFNPDLPDEIDYDAPLRQAGVVGSAFVPPDSLTFVCREPGLVNDIRRLRGDVTLAIVKLPVCDRLKEFLNATIVGDRSMLTVEMRKMFSATGLSHILALSGLHVGIIAGIVAMMLIPIRIVRWRKVETVVLICVLWLFAIMTGLTPSVVRAVIMATVFAVANMIQRVHSPLNSLCIAALLILIFSPFQIYSLGFQLSFGAVAFILVFAEKLNPVSEHRQLLHKLMSYVTATLAAMLGTAIVCAYNFNMFPVYFIPANFVGTLLLPFILGGGVLLLIIGFIGGEGVILGKCLDWLFSIFDGFTSWLSGLPGAVADDVFIGPMTLAGWFLSMIPLALWLYRKRIVYGIAFVCCIAFTVVTAVFADNRNVVGAEVYIPCFKDHTSLIARNGRQLYVYTTAPKRNHSVLADEYDRRYRKYMLKRGVDSIVIQPIAKKAPMAIKSAGQKFVFLNVALKADSSRMSSNDDDTMIDYAVVCSGFKGDIVSIAKRLNVDTVLLSADLNKRLHDKFYRNLNDAGIAVKSLKIGNLD